MDRTKTALSHKIVSLQWSYCVQKLGSTKDKEHQY